MADFTIKSDGVNVEQIMERIRERIREKRGVDYTEAEVKTLASVKLEKFLDPGAVRSDLLEFYRRNKAAIKPAVEVSDPPPPIYAFEEDTIYASSRGVTGTIIAIARKLLNPVLKLFFNPNPLIHVLHLQADINRYLLNEDGIIEKLRHRVNERERVRGDLDLLHFEVLNNLVVETTRMSIEVRNMKMRLESLASRLDFDERRARALEGVVQYKTGVTVPKEAVVGASPQAGPQVEAAGGEEASARGRRRRRRGRRRAGPPETAMDAGAGETTGGTGAAAPDQASADTAEPHES